MYIDWYEYVYMNICVHGNTYFDNDADMCILIMNICVYYMKDGNDKSSKKNKSHKKDKSLKKCKCICIYLYMNTYIYK
jgi:hypothetical protein